MELYFSFQIAFNLGYNIKPTDESLQIRQRKIKELAQTPTN